MRRNEKVITDRKRIESILAVCQVGRVATCGPNGPMIKPVNFVYIDGAFYFHSALTGEKIDHIRANPKVCFEVDGEHEFIPATTDPCKASYQYESVIATGEATFVEEPEEKVYVLNALMEKYQPKGGYKALTEKMAETVAVIRIDVNKMTAKNSPAGK